MRIRWTSHPSDPSKNGTLEHVAREFAIVACGYKQAEPAPYKNYHERLSETASVGTDPSNVNPTVSGTEWGVIAAAESQFRQDTIIRRRGAEVLYYSGPTSEMPKSIIAKWEQLVNSPNQDAVNVAAVERAKAAQADYNERAKTFKKW